MPFARQSSLQLSSYSYVPMRMRDTEDRPTPTRIASRTRCEHETTVCVDCADSWSWDWKVYWNRTVGGRNLRDSIRTAGTGDRVQWD
jgi:hypothetical protein